MAELIKCKNCGAPIKLSSSTGEKDGTVTYWHHIRSVEMGSIWCYPKADQELQEFKFAAEPKE